MTLRDFQIALYDLGFDPHGADGRWGPNTESAAMDALRALTPPRLAPEPTSIVNAQPKAVRSITEVIIHCTATPEGKGFSIETIRQWHKARGFDDIGYHYVVMLDGSVAPGRPEALIGAHVAGHNTGTLGVSYVGGVTVDGRTAKDTRTPAQRDALMALVKELIDKYPTIRKVSGHNEYAAKACPSFSVPTDPLGDLA